MAKQTFLVTYMVEGNKDVVQSFNEETNPSDVREKVEDLLKKDGFVSVSPGYYGDFFGETFVRTSKVVGYTISKELR